MFASTKAPLNLRLAEVVQIHTSNVLPRLTTRKLPGLLPLIKVSRAQAHMLACLYQFILNDRCCVAPGLKEPGKYLEL